MSWVACQWNDVVCLFYIHKIRGIIWRVNDTFVWILQIVNLQTCFSDRNWWSWTSFSRLLRPSQINEVATCGLAGNVETGQRWGSSFLGNCCIDISVSLFSRCKYASGGVFSIETVIFLQVAFNFFGVNLLVQNTWIGCTWIGNLYFCAEKWTMVDGLGKRPSRQQATAWLTLIGFWFSVQPGLQTRISNIPNMPSEFTKSHFLALN